MCCLTSFVLAGFLLGSLDVPQIGDLCWPAGLLAPAAASSSVASVGDLILAVFPQEATKDTGLKPESELAIVRYVSGEFARVVKPLPAYKKGFHIRVGAPVDEKALQQSLAGHGSAANPGDTVQITRIEFRSTQIVVEINGGRKRGRLRDHLQISLGGIPTVATTTVNSRGLERNGATLILDYGRAVPDMSPDNLKRDLSGFLDFAKERSAAVNWVETLPLEYKQAIKERRATVGMDHDMVLAAMGRPDHKVRERDPEGDETEDWIYGAPPARTTFVTFLGDKVIRVKQYP